MQAFTGTFGIYSRRALEWWTGELLGLFPHSVRSAFSEDPDGLTLYDDDGQLRVVPRGRASEGGGASVASEAVHWPDFVQRGDGAISGVAAVWLPYSACLERTFTIPAAAAQDLERINRLELERATPFKSADVLFSYMASPSPENRGALSIRQFIIKRQTLAALQTRLKNAGVDAGTITCLDKNGQKPLPINFLAGNKTGQGRKFEMLPVLAAIVFLLLATATAIAVIRSERVLSSLVARTDQARAEWQKRQASAMPALAKRDEANAISALKSRYVPSVLLLNELTHLLPDDVHLSDLKIVGQGVVISGLGRDTSRLIPLLEGSGFFTDVQLAAPVTIDPATDGERFSIRFSLRGGASAIRETAGEEPL
ncbi:PilN domain-containing protein [uncultured Hyphomicrobium sp.]|uniref:PilN domain-containing protein n=1 Tax=uncultured Hyphomicrobium sp. TaxID=194373 RepID=UPI0025F23D66|nr:PilN domain-containing protein [uncultured Hyphomicrobium sp.]